MQGCGGSWQERFLKAGRRPVHVHPQDELEGRSEDLSAHKPPFSPQEDFGENPSGNHVQAHGRWESNWEQPVHKWQIVTIIWQLVLRTWLVLWVKEEQWLCTLASIRPVTWYPCSQNGETWIWEVNYKANGLLAVPSACKSCDQLYKVQLVDSF